MSRVQNTLRTVQDLLGRGQYGTARQALILALQRDPGQPFLVHAMAMTLHRLGDHDSALHMVEPLTRAHANVPDVHCTMGMILSAMGRSEEAIAALERAVALNPRYVAALMELGSALLPTARKAEAVDVCRRAVDLEPSNPEAASRLLLALHSATRSEEAVEVARATLAKFPNHFNAAATLAYAGNYLSQTTPEQSLADHRAAGTLLAALTSARPHRFTNTRDPERRLRVGFLSKDLRTHSVAFFLEPLLAALDRTRVEVFLYSATKPEDGLTERFRTLADTWRPVFGVGGLPLAQAVRADSVDVLLELGGLTAPHLLSALEHRCAPVQVTYLGYPNTTGLLSIDYRLVDSLTDPEGAERWSVERLARLDPCFLCFQPPAEAPPPARDPRAEFTFGSFNTLQKLSDATVSLWARLLKEAPASRLYLKASQLADPDARARTLSRFERAGIPPERIELAPATATIAEHLGAYRRVDVALDTFPYAGTTTTCEALWMGVPVVTLSGATHAGRVGVSLLNVVGLPDLVAASEDDYVRISAALARDSARLTEMRGALRARMGSSALCDAPGFARRFEGVLREMWRRWCAASPP